ncbi:MAG: DUF2156 domain-containing protein [Gemmatimonadaceae bacterium]|jgi:phosphatidylglycerol lysyltransferase|nr:DUF2156 domain-containing protein [Gemmatimonadaceae bacterium]MCC6431610.1 DUF2156 domain-containing protein [Gemmatimonadaceae bacterium]
MTAPPHGLLRDDDRALALVQQFGRTSTAFQALSPGLNHWFAETPGLVAYADTGSAWVAAGEPITAPEHAVTVARGFVDAARRAGRRVSFFATEGILAASPLFQRIQLGEQPMWDPRVWAEHVRTHKSLREQLRRARAKGVRVRRVTPDDIDAQPSLRAQLDTVVRHWLATRPMPPMHFLVEVAPLSLLAHRRLLVAERAEQVVGLLSMAPVPARQGWLFEHLLRDPSAPNGTSELLVDAAMQQLAQHDTPWATLGLAPLYGDVAPWLRIMRALSRPLFNFTGLAAFKRKLRPQHWEPIFLAYPAGASSAWAVADGLRAFAARPLWRFGIHTALRGPGPLLTALEWLLIPWTLLLVLAPADVWFPSDAVKWAWVVFDVLLYALLRLVRRRAWITGARVAATAVSLDAILTLWQALAWNVPRVSDWSAALLLGIACAGPLLTAPILWGAVRRLQWLTDSRPDSSAR